MPTYDYRCEHCEARFSLFYKTYAAYDRAKPECPECSSTSVARVINRIAFKKPARDYSGMSAKEMLSVFESGDSRAVGEMFDQVGGATPELGADYHDATQRLLNGESMDKVEKDLQAKEASTPEPAPKPPAKPTPPPKKDTKSSGS